MKKDGISLLALMLAAAALVLAVVAVLRKPAAECGHSQEIATLQDDSAVLREQRDSIRMQSTAGASTGGRAELFVHGWEEKDGTLPVTEGYVQIQLGGDTGLKNTQLVLLHNGTECGRVELAMEAGESEGLYQYVLLDTWVMLPLLSEQDLRELKLEAELTSGEVIFSGDSSWYATAEGLYAVVG